MLRRMTMAFGPAAAWGQGGFEAGSNRDEARVRRDFWRKAARVAAGLPFDAIPDVLPFVGFTDDAAVLLTALRMVAGHMRAEHRDAARAALARIKAGTSSE